MKEATVKTERRGAHDTFDATTPKTVVPLTTDQVWAELDKASFLVLSQVTPEGEPRSSGVLYKTKGGRLYIATAPNSWKARHIAANTHVGVTVPVRRGGILSLVAPIPPATINFHATAIVHAPGSMELPDELAALVPPERRSESCVIELVPQGSFLTYGIGVPLMKMRKPDESRGRVPVL
jgi:hypothetical protein